MSSSPRPTSPSRHAISVLGAAVLVLPLLAGCSVSSLGSASPTNTVPATTSGTPTPTSGSDVSGNVGSINYSPRIHTDFGGTVPMPNVDQLAVKVINKVSPSIVKVVNVNVGLGSGVIMSSDGYIVTNDHVVKGAHAIRVTLANGKVLPARIIGTDITDDLAVIKINASGLPYATFGDSSALQVGQTVLAIGNPLGITRTVTEGIVSATDRTVTEGQTGGSIPRAIQTSAPINPGNSGGALVDLAGEVVGIPTLAAIDPEFNAPATGIGFAIPSTRVVLIASQIIKYGKVKHSGRAAVGISAADVTPQLAAQYGLPVQHGVLIGGFTANSPAKQAGLKQGDIIVKAGGHQITSTSDLLDVLAQKTPGDKLQLTVVTPNGNKKQVTVTLGELNVQQGH